MLFFNFSGEMLIYSKDKEKHLPKYMKMMWYLYDWLFDKMFPHENGFDIEYFYASRSITRSIGLYLISGTYNILLIEVLRTIRNPF